MIKMNWQIPSWRALRAKRERTLLAAVCAVSVFGIAADVGAQGTPPAAGQSGKVNTVIGEQVKTEEAARASQKRVEQLDEETTKMLADYRQMTAEAQSLKGYNEQLALQVKSQDEQMSTMAQQVGDIETTSREVLPMMNRMLSTLETFVSLDLPFLAEERSNRIAALKDIMGRADISTSEKYRRLVEAYQIEMEYGRTIE